MTAKELLADVAGEAERTLWPNGSAEFQAQARIMAVLERRLLAMLEAGELMQKRLQVLSDEVGASEAVSSMAWTAAKAVASEGKKRG